MTGSYLLRPISGEVDADGRLIQADDALAKLNQRAGGIKDGILAVPAITRLALLSIKLQMKLSRAVRVADNNENLELWIEIQPQSQRAKLSIVSWRSISDPQIGQRKATLSAPEHCSLIKFDLHGRLVRATGKVAHGLVAGDFGRDAREILVSVFENGADLDQLANAVANRSIASACVLRRVSDGLRFNVCGNSVGNGYDLSFEESVESLKPAESKSQSAAASTLFGKNLAPVLRQPLGRIIANAETIGSELQGPIRENYALYARDIANAARHLSALVDDLGDLEAVEKPDFKTAKDEIELGDVARRVRGLLALKAADHRITIHTPHEEHKVNALAEFRRTLQILLNLVNNAIRYSPDGTEIFIETELLGTYAEVSVRDQGEGIAAEDQEKIFEKFERLGRSGDGGSGLGLYISRRLARAMGGDLTVGDAEGGGAKFTLRLPGI